MLTPLAQRWRDKRGTYRPAGEVINTRNYEVARNVDRALAIQFVKQHHYSGSVCTIDELFTFYEHGELVGVAIFSEPQHKNSLTNVFPNSCISHLLELGRFILLDRVPGNGESFLHARCREQLKKDYAGYVAFADDTPRRDTDGNLIFRGHLGCHYQASNAVLIGRGTKRTLRLFNDGRVYSDRAAQKVRAAEKGWRYAARQLEEAGAPPVPEAEQERRAWLRHWRIALTRPLPHPGALKYAWSLDKSVRLPKSLPYPKFTAAQLQPQLF